MKNLVFAILSILVVICIEVNAQTLETLWEVTGLETPESVIYDAKQKLYYVSNIAGDPTQKDGNGFISKIDEQGKVVSQKWVTGFDAPKGMGIHNGKLYVADITKVSVVDIKSGKIERSFTAEGSAFLNDIAVASNGDVYISDTFTNTIYTISKNQISVWFQDALLNSPNGLFIKGNDMLVATWGEAADEASSKPETKGKLIRVSMSDKKVSDITTPFINGDGLAPYKNGYVLSDWVAGKIYFVDNKGSYQEIGSYNSGTADLELITSKNLLLIPQMKEGKLLAFSLK